MKQWHKVLPWIIAHDVEIFLTMAFIVGILTALGI